MTPGGNQWCRSVAGALFLGAFAASIAPVTAWGRGQFGAPFILSGEEQICGVPRTAISADGNAIFTWETRGGDADGFANFKARARARSKTGVFGPILTVSGRSFDSDVDPRPAIDATGNALIAWTLVAKGKDQEHHGPAHTQFRTLSSAGALGPVKEMSRAIPADSARVAMSPNGKAVLFWRRPNNNDTLATMETRTRSAGGVLGAVKTVSPFRNVPAFSPEVAMNARGDAVFAWQRRINGNIASAVVQARRRSASGALGQLYQNIGTGAGVGSFGANPVAIDGQGNAIISFVEDVSGSTRVEMRRLSAGDVLGPQQFISQGGGGVADVRVAMNTAGDAAFTYREFDGTVNVAKANVRSAAGGIAAPQTLSPPGFSATFSGAAIDAHARSMFVWGGGDFGSENAQARIRSAVGALGGIRTVDTATLVMATSVAMNPRGDAAAVWCEAKQVGSGSGDFVFTIHGALTPVP